MERYIGVFPSKRLHVLEIRETTSSRRIYCGNLYTFTSLFCLLYLFHAWFILCIFNLFPSFNFSRPTRLNKIVPWNVDLILVTPLAFIYQNLYFPLFIFIFDKQLVIHVYITQSYIHRKNVSNPVLPMIRNLLGHKIPIFFSIFLFSAKEGSECLLNE